MSYILDAIKKSEQQRQRSKGPSLDLPQIAPYTHKSNTLLVYVLIAACILLIGILLNIFSPWKKDNSNQIEIANNTAQSPVTNSAPPSSQTAPLPAIVLPSPSENKHQLPITNQRPIPIMQKSAPKTNTSKKPVQEKVVPQEKSAEAPFKLETVNPVTESKAVIKDVPMPTVQEKTAPSEEASATDHANEIALQNRLLDVSELPPHIQQDIPEMSIAGFAFSSVPSERSVGINGRLLQEGDYLKQGLRLDKINSDGLIFSYKGYHFRQNLQ